MDNTATPPAPSEPNQDSPDSQRDDVQYVHVGKHDMTWLYLHTEVSELIATSHLNMAGALHAMNLLPNAEQAEAVREMCGCGPRPIGEALTYRDSPTMRVGVVFGALMRMILAPQAVTVVCEDPKRRKGMVTLLKKAFAESPTLGASVHWPYPNVVRIGTRGSSSMRFVDASKAKHYKATTVVLLGNEAADAFDADSDALDETKCLAVLQG
jgi:hypothetical protein